MRFLLGVAEAGFLPGIIYYLSQWFPRERTREGRLVVHDRHSAVDRCSARRSPAGCSSFDGTCGLQGWQWMYPRRGPARRAPGLRRAVSISRTNPPTRGGSSAEQRDWLSAADSTPNTSQPKRNTVSRCARCCVHPTVWLLALIMFCCQTGSYGLTFWVPHGASKGLTDLSHLARRPVDGDSIHRCGARHDSARPQLRSSRRTHLHVAIPTIIGACGFIATGLHAGADPRAASRSPSPPLATTARAARSGRCPASFSPASAAAAGIALHQLDGRPSADSSGRTSIGLLLQDHTGNFRERHAAAGADLVGRRSADLASARSPTLKELASDAS